MNPVPWSGVFDSRLSRNVLHFSHYGPFAHPLEVEDAFIFESQTEGSVECSTPEVELVNALEQNG